MIQWPIFYIFVDRFNRSVVRIFALEEDGGVGVDFNCRWFSTTDSKGEHVINEVPAKKFWVDTSWPHWSTHFACEYACTVSAPFREETIQLTSQDLKYSFKVEVEYVQESGTRKNLAVCLKPQTNSQVARRLVEWFEMLQAVGIGSVIAYTTDVTGSSRYVFQYYEEKGLLTAVPFPYLWTVILRLEQRFPKMSGEARYALYQQIYLIAMHDCLHRFSKEYKFILFLDTDEVITPSDPEEDMESVVVRAEKEFPQAAGFLFFTSWHWEESGSVKSGSVKYGSVKSGSVKSGVNEEYLYMQRFAKGTTPSDKGPRSAVSTSRAITINFHEVLDVPNTKFTSETMAWKDFAYVHHYRGKCRDLYQAQVCESMLNSAKVDKTITRLKDDVQTSVEYVLDQLQLNI